MRKFTGLRSDKRNSFVGNGKLSAVLTAALNTDDKALIYINSDLGQLAGEDARKHIDKQTVASTTAGAVTLKRYMKDETGTALASGVVVEIEGTEYTCGAGGVITHTLAIATYATVQAMIDAINALPGFIATIGDALTTTPLATDKHVAVTEANIPFIGFDPIGAVLNDVSATNVAYLRLGIPTRKDRGPIQLIQVRGLITAVAGGAVTLQRDDQDEYVSDGSHLEEYDAWTPAADATLEKFVDNTVIDAADYRGPMVLKVAATDITGASFHIQYRQALV